MESDNSLNLNSQTNQYDQSIVPEESTSKKTSKSKKSESNSLVDKMSFPTSTQSKLPKVTPLSDDSDQEKKICGCRNRCMASNQATGSVYSKETGEDEAQMRMLKKEKGEDEAQARMIKKEIGEDESQIRTNKKEIKEDILNQGG